MNSKLFLAALTGLVALTSPAQILYQQDFESFLDGATEPDAWWSFQGPATTTGSMTVQSVGVGGSKALNFNIDSSGAVGTDWFFYAGFGRSDTAIAGSLLGQNPESVSLTLDIAMFGATLPNPLTIYLNQFSGETKVWETAFAPVLTTDGSFTHLAFTLDQGIQTGTWDPSLPLSLNSISFNSGGFPLAPGNQVIIDNLQLAIPEPTTLALLGLGAGFLWIQRRRK
jgi:hypothetical protein